MSKTYRCKNYELSHPRQDGSKTAGWYTEYDYVNRLCVYREPTPEERYYRYLRAHGESRHRNARSPSWYYRHERMVENRSINKQELFRCINQAEYEPLFEANPRSCCWDWM